MVKLSALRERKITIEKRKSVIAAALSKYGIDVEGIRVVEHKTRRKYIDARKHATKEEKTGRISSFIFGIIYRLAPKAGGFCDLRSGEVHFERGTGVVTRLHESVHGADLLRPRLREMVDEAISEEKDISIRRPLDYLRFKLKEIRLIAVLEGRAKFCERLAGKDDEFTLWERAKFKLSRNAEAALFVLSTYLGAKYTIDIIQFPHPIYVVITLPPILLAFWLSVKNLPYVLGMRFMEYTEQETNSPSEALEITVNHPPSLIEILRPSTYFKTT